MRRNTQRNTSWDLAKFEVVGHRFIDLSDRDYGAAVLNDCKRGYKVLDDVIDLNFLLASTMSDPRGDGDYISSLTAFSLAPASLFIRTCRTRRRSSISRRLVLQVIPEED